MRSHSIASICLLGFSALVSYSSVSYGAPTSSKPAKPFCRQNADGRGTFSIQEENNLLEATLFGSEQESYRALMDSGENKSYLTPTRRVPPAQWPDLTDDLNFRDLNVAIDRQLEYFKNRSPQGYIRFGTDNYPLSEVSHTLQVFRQYVANYLDCTAEVSSELCRKNFNKAIKANFVLYTPQLKKGDPRFGEDKQALFTGYYTPAIHVSRTRSAEFPHAIFADPEGAKRRTSRRDIDFHQALAGLGLELFYAPDLFEIYLAHVQGNAHVYLDDEGQSYYLNYAGSNGMRFEFISKYMYEKKFIDDTSIEAQHDYLTAHPEKQEEVYATCPNYIYYLSTDRQPTGSGGVAVTANRSIATDNDYYGFKGTLAFVKGVRPKEHQRAQAGRACLDVEFRPFSRFYLDQDIGGGVRGKARADLFFGEGAYAQLAAFNEDDRGDIYFLMLKK